MAQDDTCAWQQGARLLGAPDHRLEGYLSSGIIIIIIIRDSARTLGLPG